MKNKKLVYITGAVIIIVLLIILGISIYNIQTKGSEKYNYSSAEEQKSQQLHLVEGKVLEIENSMVEIQDEQGINYGFKVSQEVCNFDLDTLEQADIIKVTYMGELSGEVNATKVEMITKSTKEETTLKGKIIDASMNNLILQVGNKEYTISTMGADIQVDGGIVIGNEVTITYKGALENGIQALKIR